MHVVIVTPKLDGREHAGHARSIRNAEKAAREKGWRFDYIDVSGSPVLPQVRNLLVAQALTMGADEIVFVDNDIAFAPEQFVALIERDCELVGAAPQARLNRWDEGGHLVWKALPGGGVIDPETFLMEVAGLGGGFMKARRSVFERIAAAGLAPLYLMRDVPPAMWPELRRYFSYGLTPFDPAEDPWLAAKLKATSVAVPDEQLCCDEGEDYFFCRSARAAGVKVFIDAKLEVAHHEGRCVLDLSLRQIENARREAEQQQQAAA